MSETKKFRAPDTANRSSLRELALLFLRLGTTAFGGPAAHIAMMEDEVVRRRSWMTSDEFLDLLGATNLIPGPNSTEMAIHIGHRQAGWKGLLVAGTSFILPAVLIVTAFGWAYVRYGSLPQVTGIRYGVKPVIIAVVPASIVVTRTNRHQDQILSGRRHSRSSPRLSWNQRTPHSLRRRYRCRSGTIGRAADQEWT